MKEQNGVIEMEAGSVDWEVMSDMIGIDEDGNEFWSDDFVRINNLFIKPEFRGQGFARKLVEAADELIRKQHPDMKIKIVAGPKEESVDFDRLASFYASRILYNLFCFAAVAFVSMPVLRLVGIILFSLIWLFTGK